MYIDISIYLYRYIDIDIDIYSGSILRLAHSKSVIISYICCVTELLKKCN